MPNDRLHNDSDQIYNLDDIIEAREERTSALADDRDGMEDVESPDIDVDEALTFPHPKRNHSAGSDVELMDTPRAEDIGFDYQDSAEEMLPAEYTSDYNEELTTHVSDDDQEVVDEAMDEIGDLTTDDLIYNTPIVDLPEHGGPRGAEAQETEE